MIGQTRTIQTVEYTVCKLRAPVRYLLERDGVEMFEYPTIEACHKAAKALVKSQDEHGAGLTEAFGRNRQFVASKRGAWVRWKEPVCEA